jgi:hypothetical protein
MNTFSSLMKKYDVTKLSDSDFCYFAKLSLDEMCAFLISKIDGDFEKRYGGI